MTKKRQPFSLRRQSRRDLTVDVQLEGSGHEHSSAVDVLQQLAARNAMSNFLEAFARPSLDGRGDCHEVSMALMVDLVMAGAADDWAYVLGELRTTEGEVDHSWLEFDGWAVDASNGTIKVASRASYPATKVVRSMNLTEFQAWVDAGAPGVSAGK